MRYREIFLLPLGYSLCLYYNHTLYSTFLICQLSCTINLVALFLQAARPITDSRKVKATDNTFACMIHVRDHYNFFLHRYKYDVLKYKLIFMAYCYLFITCLLHVIAPPPSPYFNFAIYCLGRNEGFNSGSGEPVHPRVRTSHHGNHFSLLRDRGRSRSRQGLATYDKRLRGPSAREVSFQVCVLTCEGVSLCGVYLHEMAVFVFVW